MKKHAAHSRAKNRHKAVIKAKRPVHKKILLHPAAIFMLLCAGVLLLGWTFKAHADDSYTVKGKVPAPPLTQPAIITAPIDGAHFKTKPIDITGTCEYQSYIKLYRNGAFAGTALCQSDGTFAMQTDLEPGSNSLQAHAFNITDDEGPSSPSISVYYEPPLPPLTRAASNPNLPPAAVRRLAYKPLIISSDYKYQAFQAGEQLSWPITISGGDSPYALNVKWGDGSESNYVQKASGQLSIEHVYTKAGTFTIQIKAVDYRGYQASLQLGGIIVKDKQATISVTTPSSSSGQASGLNAAALLALLWPAYAIVVMMVLSFLLGERQEYYALLKRRPRRRAH